MSGKTQGSVGTAVSLDMHAGDLTASGLGNARGQPLDGVGSIGEAALRIVRDHWRTR
jgi:hypothetical protein